jgi:hypothetical protein
MRRILVPVLMFLLIPACGGMPPTGEAEQALIKNEVLGGFFATQSDGVYEGGAIWVLGHSLQMPQLPYLGLESVNASFRTEATISSDHADGGYQKIRFWAYRPASTIVNGHLIPSDHYVAGIDRFTNDGSGNLTGGTVNFHTVHAGDGLSFFYNRGDAAGPSAYMASDNASGLGSWFDERVSAAFTAGQPDPDTIYPFKQVIGVADCSLDMPKATGQNYGPGSYTTQTYFVLGSNGPVVYPGTHTPNTAGCALSQSYSASTHNTTVSYNTLGTP